MTQDRPDHYPFRDIETKWQRVWEETDQFRVREEPGRPKYYCLEMFPYPSGRIHMGHVRNYAIGDLLARFKWMRGLQRPAPDGLGRLRAARRERRHRQRRPPGGVDAREHREHEGAAAALGHLLRLGPRGRHLRSGVLPLGAAHLHPHVRARARLPEERARQLVPSLPDDPRQRAGRGRPLLALRLRGRHQGDRGLVLQDHRLRRGAPRVVRPAGRLARARPDDAAQLDRPERGGGVRPPRGRHAGPRHPGLHDAARHLLRHDVRRAGAGAPPRRPARRRCRRGDGGGGLPGGRSRGSPRSSASPPTGPSGASACARARSTRSTAPRSRCSSPTTC